MRQVLVLLAIGWMILGACKKKEKEDEVEPLLGKWTIECGDSFATFSSEATSEDAEDDDFHRTVTREYLADKTVVITEVKYSAAGCEEEDLYTTSTLTGTWTIGENAVDIRDKPVRNIDYTYTKSEFTLHTDALLELFNDAESCGGGFEIDTVKEIESGTNACSLTAKGDEYYDIFAITDNKLKIGVFTKDRYGETEDTRLEILHPDEDFVR